MIGLIINQSVPRIFVIHKLEIYFDLINHIHLSII
jgi:hypothetical protein